MHRDSRPPAAAALLGVLAGAVAGPAAQLQQPALWGPGGYALVLAGSLAVLLLAPRLRGPGAGAAWFVAVALAAFAATGARATAFAAQALDPALEGRDLWLTGRVAGLPQWQTDGVRFRVEVEGALLQGAPVRLPPRIALGWYGAGEEAASAPPVLRPGERWRLAVRLKAPHGHANPHGFDYELWLWEQGVQATGYVRAGPRDPPPQRLASTWQAPVDRLRDAVRERIFARVPEARWAGVLAALVVGDQGAIEREDWEVFRATGVAHLMSISGLHVTLFAWVAALLVGRAWRRSARLCLALPAPQAAGAGGLALALAYAIFSGWGVPAQRTIWMLATVTALRWGAREWPWPCIWLLACAVVVTVDPWALLQPGFWLSFVAVGVLFASARPPPGPDDAPRRWGPHALLRHLAGLAREQWVVTLALTPLSLLLFGQVSLVGLVANLVAIPWVTWIVTPLGLLGVAWPAAWDAGAATAAALGAGLEWLSLGPWVTASVAAAPLWAGIAGVAGGALLVLPLPGAWRALGLPLLVPVLLWQPARPPPGSFELLAADVGQGNAVLVRTARRALLYDAGPAYSRDTDAGQRVLVPLLRALGERLDLVVLSHRDVDHTGGAAAVLAAHGAAALVSSLEPGHELLRLRPSRACEAGASWEWDGVHFAFLHPSAAAAAAGGVAAAPKPNARSCVLLVVAADGGRALLAGDIERAQEAEVLQRASDVHAHLLLVPHHGSKTSSSEAWLAAVAPALALVQAGYRNRFGHPAGEVVERHARRGIRLVATPACGAARWASRAPRELQCERALRPRYWHHALR